MYVVYMLEREDGLRYIGQARKNRFKGRLTSHKNSKRFSELTIKDTTVLYETESYDEALRRETEFINLYDTYRNGLNKTTHGKGIQDENGKLIFSTLGVPMSAETKEKIRAKSKENKNHLFAHAVWDDPEKSQILRLRFSELRKGKAWRKPKLSEQEVREILDSYFSKTPVPGCGSKKNGIECSYERAFSTHFCKRYNMSNVGMFNLVCGKTIIWKELYEEMMNMKF